MNKTNKNILLPVVKEKLFEYQYENAIHGIRAILKHNLFLNTSSTGTGKTYTTLAIAKQLDLKPFIVCPKIVIPCWEKALKHFGLDCITVVNYELLRNGKILRIEQAKQKAELLKIPSIITMIEIELSNKNSIAVFINYRETLHQLEIICNKRKIHTVSIQGNQKENELNRQLFQSNKIHVILCNIQASKEGIDLHDIYHKRERIALISPCYNPQDIKQILGRIDRVGGTNSIQKFLVAEETLEQTVMKKVIQKMYYIDTFNQYT